MDNSINIDVVKFPHAADLPLPSHASVGSAGLDLYAAIGDALLVLRPACTILVPTGIAVAIPFGFEGQIRPRSGIATKSAVGIINSPGTIDSDYRGEIKVPLHNFGGEDFEISAGMRIAHMVISRYFSPSWNVVDALCDTVRGQSGFGSTGS